VLLRSDETAVRFFLGHFCVTPLLRAGFSRCQRCSSLRRRLVQLGDGALIPVFDGCPPLVDERCQSWIHRRWKYLDFEEVQYHTFFWNLMSRW
jgi:hypothetical protein